MLYLAGYPLSLTVDRAFEPPLCVAPCRQGGLDCLSPCHQTHSCELEIARPPDTGPRDGFDPSSNPDVQTDAVGIEALVSRRVARVADDARVRAFEIIGERDRAVTIMERRLLD